MPTLENPVVSYLFEAYRSAQNWRKIYLLGVALVSSLMVAHIYTEQFSLENNQEQYMLVNYLNWGIDKQADYDNQIIGYCERFGLDISKYHKNYKDLNGFKAEEFPDFLTWYNDRQPILVALIYKAETDKSKLADTEKKDFEKMLLDITDLYHSDLRWKVELDNADLGKRSLPFSMELDVNWNDYVPIMSIVLAVFSLFGWVNLNSISRIIKSIKEHNPSEMKFQLMIEPFFLFSRDRTGKALLYGSIWLAPVVLVGVCIADLAPVVYEMYHHQGYQFGSLGAQIGRLSIYCFSLIIISFAVVKNHEEVRTIKSTIG